MVTPNVEPYSHTVHFDDGTSHTCGRPRAHPTRWLGSPAAMAGVRVPAPAVTRPHGSACPVMRGCCSGAPGPRGIGDRYTTLERPFLYIDPTGVPTHLSLAADLVTGDAGCNTESAGHGTACTNCKCV
jgi:hypothetical protein